MAMVASIDTNVRLKASLIPGHPAATPSSGSPQYQEDGAYPYVAPHTSVAATCSGYIDLHGEAAGLYIGLLWRLGYGERDS